MIELGQILTRVLERTTEGKLKWSRTVRSDRFVASIDAISMVIMEIPGRISNHHQLDILSEEGETIDSLSHQDTTAGQDTQLERLFQLARRSALDVDATLEKLAKALDI